MRCPEAVGCIALWYSRVVPSKPLSLDLKTTLRFVTVVGAVLVGCGGPPPRTVRQVDLDAWNGVPVIELETHSLFSTLPRYVRKISDGSELWTFSNCKSGTNDVQCGSSRIGSNYVATNCSGGDTWRSCCNHQFMLRGGVVESYRPVGSCFTDCSRRPASRQCGSEGSFAMTTTAGKQAEDPRLLEIRKTPKPPQLGATVAEVKVICTNQRGIVVEREDVVGCRVGGEAIFACKHADQQMYQCDTYYEAGDLGAFEAATEKEFGPPPEVRVGPDGFRVFSWPGRGYVLTMYSKGVRVTLSKPRTE